MASFFVCLSKSRCYCYRRCEKRVLPIKRGNVRISRLQKIISRNKNFSRPYQIGTSNNQVFLPSNKVR
jgi:hypothetical protein